jgi:hypothetical protein
VPLYQSDRANECADNELGCTVSLKAAVLPGHQLTGPSEEEEEEEEEDYFISVYLVLCFKLYCG